MSESFWDIHTVDRLVGLVVTLVVFLGPLGLALFLRGVANGTVRARVLETTLLSLGVLGGVFAVYVAYATLRNQSRLSAEIAINEDAARIAEWEQDRPWIRCLYTWFDRRAAPQSADAPDPVEANECLAAIVADREKYTGAMLYIEEALFLLQQATRDRDRWGSSYADEIAYWQADVGEDPTGLFSYHLVQRYPLDVDGPENARELTPQSAMKAAGVEIDYLCARADRVRLCLEAAGRHATPPPSDVCAKFRPLPSKHPMRAGVQETCSRVAAQVAAARQGRP